MINGLERYEDRTVSSGKRKLNEQTTKRRLLEPTDYLHNQRVETLSFGKQKEANERAAAREMEKNRSTSTHKMFQLAHFSQHNNCKWQIRID